MIEKADDILITKRGEGKEAAACSIRGVIFKMQKVVLKYSSILEKKWCKTTLNNARA